MKELRDQAAHVAVVVVTLGPLVATPSPWAGLWAGFAIGMVAEVKERGNPVTWDKVMWSLESWKDLGFYSLTGLLLVSLGAKVF